MDAPGPELPELIVQQVQALLERRRTAQARALLGPALKNHPEHPGLLLQGAWADYIDDRYDDALATVRQVLVREPHDETARLLAFELLVEKQQYAEAEQFIIGLLRENPATAHYYGRYATLMLTTLVLPKARQLAEEGLKYNPDDPECLAALTIHDFVEGRTGSRALEKLVVNDPHAVRTLLLVVMALEERGELREAQRVAQELLRTHPDNPQLVELAHQFHVGNHWSMLPLWPMRRFGWGGSFAMWVGMVALTHWLSRAHPDLTMPAVTVLLIYVVYSWVWPPLLGRLMR